ncbi:Phosphatidylglycerol/phosphatidylinositol transfer protein [Quaeritorhiza haematococci]|nr:Phosphatidylglycerol/phosphatidylinositol transfer protein [Quaeritorhiza haematococci]
MVLRTLTTLVLSALLLTTTTANPISIKLWPQFEVGKKADFTIQQTATWCGAEGDIFQLKSLVISPDPPKRGQSLDIMINGTLSEDIVPGAYAEVKVKLGLVKLFDGRIDFCEEIKQVGEECPIPKGPLGIAKTVDIPSELPPGRYMVHVTAHNADELPIACLDAVFRL